MVKKEVPDIIYKIPLKTEKKKCALCFRNTFWITKDLCVNPDGEPHWKTCNLGKHKPQKRWQGKRW